MMSKSVDVFIIERELRDTFHDIRVYESKLPIDFFAKSMFFSGEYFDKTKLLSLFLTSDY